MFQKFHPGDTPEHSGTWISSDWSDGMVWGWVESFVHSEQVLSLLSSLLSHTKWKCQQWRRATCFFRSFQRQCPLSHSIPFLADYSCSLQGAAIVAENSCTAQTQTPSAVQIHRIKIYSAALRVPQTTSHDSNYGSTWRLWAMACSGVPFWRSQIFQTHKR